MLYSATRRSFPRSSSASPNTATPWARFEGANYEAEGYYRSEQNCLMFTRYEHFCQVCSAAIEDVIDEYTKDTR